MILPRVVPSHQLSALPLCSGDCSLSQQHTLTIGNITTNTISSLSLSLSLNEISVFGLMKRSLQYSKYLQPRHLDTSQGPILTLAMISLPPDPAFVRTGVL